MAPKRQISEDQARDIKRRIWVEDKLTDIAADYGVSQPTISGIKSGRAYYEVEWPDGQVGGMPKKVREIKFAKFAPATADPLARLRAIASPEQMAILEAGIARIENEQHADEQRKFKEDLERIKARGIASGAWKLPGNGLKAYGPLEISGLDLLSWDDILRRVPTSSYVIAAEQTQDEELKLVLRVLLSGDLIPSDEQVKVMIPQVKERMVA